MQRMATGQPPNAMNQPAGKKISFELLLRVIIPQLDKERAMQLRGLYVQLRSNKFNKEEFFRHLRSLVGDHMLKMAVYKLRQWQWTAKPSVVNNAQKQRLLEQQSDSHVVQVSHNSSSASGINAKTPPIKPTVDQKKPLEASVSSLSKKQKVSGVFSDQSRIGQLNDATAVSHSKMEVQDLALEKTSSLPPNIIQTILTLMPMRDAFRTSILSNNWRNQCLNIPKLMFDDAVFQGPTCKNLSIRFKLLYVVYPILLLHQGPLLELSLCISQLISCCEIDQIILHLSKSATLKKFTLCIKSGDDHKLLPAFFNLQQLTVLKLQNCVFQPPVTFKGFSRLVSLCFNNVSLTAKVLLRFIYYCPQLKDFTLTGNEKHLMGCWNSDFAECLPLVERLCMSSYPAKCFATGVMLRLSGAPAGSGRGDPIPPAGTPPPSLR
ncbi:putative F-box domain, RST domain, leucine-rich repeat domain superfamily [Helianthus annuus]|nr:putative F-box domain, RST domain, leucine-rich repeat domain superfamily [Helianthus annuus]KAJ0828597.1 putative F-box domain, RST domain, leucine-rich repeat domain superfamily [Helianthus annuus]